MQTWSNALLADMPKSLSDFLFFCRLLDIFSVIMAGVNIHAETIKMGDGECFNYLVANESNDQYTLYLHNVSKHQSGYKTKVSKQGR